MDDSSSATNDNRKKENATLKDSQPPKQEQRVLFEVRREETRRNVMMGKTKVDPTPPETNALVVEAAAFKSSTNQKNSSNLWCDHYNKPRHTRETCWKIHGRPTHIKGSKSDPKAPRPFPTAHEAEKTSLS
ncbi:hypothetical protein SESBI_41828 [Sesbania bispinosa]|nr:hypothetical protein SESBI_41828 [Sesbania bispinosa]